jgi:hypothetical protein
VTALINPRKDLARVAEQMYRALKLKPCGCEHAWGKDGYAVVKQCGGCAAIFAYEVVTEFSSATHQG